MSLCVFVFELFPGIMEGRVGLWQGCELEIIIDRRPSTSLVFVCDVYAFSIMRKENVCNTMNIIWYRGGGSQAMYYMAYVIK